MGITVLGPQGCHEHRDDVKLSGSKLPNRSINQIACGFVLFRTPTAGSRLRSGARHDDERRRVSRPERIFNS
jgi:hypothetical protein